MLFELNGIKIEYQEETYKKIKCLKNIRDDLQAEKNKITDDIFSGTVSTQVFKDELQEIIDYYDNMIEVCHEYSKKFIDIGDV
ncbi:hypothetical protein RZE82_06445 [Mollicutes bacterium LVI A0039]|nr:hypothetical protein RZE82_06445 [Mollicutes bacterium LVI A0039]